MRHTLLLALCLLLLPCAAPAFVRSTSILAVPDDGSQFDRDLWNPTNGSFPAVNGTYTDPVFGEVITRLTNIYPAGGSDLAHKHQWNADGTKFFWRTSNQVHVRTPSGTQTDTNIPGGFVAGTHAQWSPFNPDLYYYTTSQSIWQRNVATDTTTEVKNFGSALSGIGDYEFWVVHPEDDTANPTNLLFLINIGGLLQVWDQTRNTILGGTATFTNTRLAGLSPDGRWLIRVDSTSTPPVMASVRVNVLAGTVGDGSTSGQAGTPFWEDMDGDHMGIVSTTTGKTYVITNAAMLERWHYRVDVSLNQSGRTRAQQAADNLRLWQTDASGQTGNSHYSCAMHGAMRNYCWASNEDYAETAAAPGTWYANKQETLLIYMPTGQVFRMAHHRSYPLQSRFCSSSRVNSALDGTHAFFLSGMGVGTAEGTCGYADVYLLDGRSVTAQKPWTRRPLYAVR